MLITILLSFFFLLFFFFLYHRHCGKYRTALGHQNFILQKLMQIQAAVKNMKETTTYSKKDELRKNVV